MLSKEKEKRIMRLESRLMPGPSSGTFMSKEDQEKRIRELAAEWISSLNDEDFKEFATEAYYRRAKADKNCFGFFKIEN